MAGEVTDSYKEGGLAKVVKDFMAYEAMRQAAADPAAFERQLYDEPLTTAAQFLPPLFLGWGAGKGLAGLRGLRGPGQDYGRPDVATTPVVGENQGSRYAFNVKTIAPNLKTEANKAFFWSGKTEKLGGDELAAEHAKLGGGHNFRNIS